MRIPNRIGEAFKRYAFRVMASRKPDFVIGGADAYMNRWFAIPRNKLLNIFVHQFLRDDNDEALHDHPWLSLSLTVQGVAREVYAPKGANPSDPEQHASRSIGAGDVTWRGLNFAHRIEVVDGPIVTIFITGPKLREWGFWCPKGWRSWDDFVIATKDGNERGRGCE